MRTTTSKSFTIALALTTLLAVPVFAGRDDAKRQPRGGDQQPNIVQRFINKLVHVFDGVVVVPHPDVPSDSAVTTT